MKQNIAILGTGVISETYLDNLTNLFREVQVVGVCDLIPERSKEKAEKFGIKKIYKDSKELLSDPEVEIVLDLTEPVNHYHTLKEIIEAGKHAFVEKPLSTSYQDGKEIVELAAKQGVRLGGAPDTFLGAGIQTCRKLVEDGYIGEVIAVNANMMGHGPETWHPGPEFFYQKGGGPMLDMGPYYVTALINICGGINKVAGFNTKGFSERVITSEPHYGQKVTVEIPTHVCGTLKFDSGAVGTITESFDVWKANVPAIEIYGTKGSLSVPDPNSFGGPFVELTHGGGEWFKFPIQFGYWESHRGLGVSDMAKAIATNRPHRCSANQVLHVLEVMEKIITSGQQEQYLSIETKFTKTAPMVEASVPGILD